MNLLYIFGLLSMMSYVSVVARSGLDERDKAGVFDYPGINGDAEDFSNNLEWVRGSVVRIKWSWRRRFTMYTIWLYQVRE